MVEQKRIQSILKKNNVIVLVYTIGKVGSSSVYKSLKENENQKFPVFHIHSLNPERIATQEQYYRQSKRSSIPFNLIQAKILADCLKNYTGKIYLFTLIREPIIREISSLFQDLFNFFSSKSFDELVMKEIVQKKLNKLRKVLPEEEWFDSELNTVFQIDIYSNDFDPKKGFALFNKNNLRVVLTRLEDLNENFDEACQHLFETDEHFELKEMNRSDYKFYHEQYSELKDELRLNQNELNKIINNKFIQNFYPDYIDTIRKRWQKGYEDRTD